MKNYYWGADKSKGKDKDKDKDDSILTLDLSKDSVEVVDNTIFFYSPVSQDSVLNLNKELRELDKRHRSLAVELDLAEPPPIKLHIHSYGGELFAGFAAADAILSCATPVHTHVEGCAASAATIMSVVGDYRTIGANSFMLIHQLSSVFWGKHDEWKDEMVNLDLLMERAKIIYAEHSKLTKKDLGVILKRDLWYDAEKSLKCGLVDEIK
jgi:ATP-dependent protease ClpP protease subunit